MKRYILLFAISIATQNYAQGLNGFNTIFKRLSTGGDFATIRNDCKVGINLTPSSATLHIGNIGEGEDTILKLTGALHDWVLFRDGDTPYQLGLNFVNRTSGTVTRGIFRVDTSSTEVNWYWVQETSGLNPTQIMNQYAPAGSGTNRAASDMNFYGGRATGSAASGDIVFYTGITGGSGTTVQSTSEQMRIQNNNGGVSVRKLNLGDTTGVVLTGPGAATASVGNLVVDTFGAAALDTLVTLTGAIGDIILIRTRDSGRDLAILDSGNFALGAERLLDNIADSIILIAITTTTWREIVFSNNQ